MGILGGATRPVPTVWACTGGAIGAPGRGAGAMPAPLPGPINQSPGLGRAHGLDDGERRSSRSTQDW